MTDLLNPQYNLLEDLKQNAPVIYQMHVARKRRKLNTLLNDFRHQYKTSEDPEEKKKIEYKANIVKKELESLH